MLEEIINNIQSDTIIRIGKRFIDINTAKINGKFEMSSTYKIAKMFPIGDTVLIIVVHVPKLSDTFIDGRYIDIKTYWYIDEEALIMFDLNSYKIIDYDLHIRKEKIKTLIDGRIS